MAPLLEDPRFRQTWNQFSQNAESATETAAAGIWTFQHRYITPCLASVASSFEQCTGQCIPDREERARRRDRGHTRGRAESNFDFYDDWDEDISTENRGLLGGWANDELDRLLAGSGSHSGHSEGITKAPRRKRGMSYGTRGRKKTLDPDPTVIPSTSALGFLGRLPFKLGGTLRYKPSAADLQDHPGTLHAAYRDEEEGEPLIPDDQSDNERQRHKGHTRNRSDTVSSGETTDSFRSRGDLFPSDGEDDAVPLDDEFAMVLERRIADDHSSGKTRASRGKRTVRGKSISSRNVSTGTQSTRSRPSLEAYRTKSGTSVSYTPDGSTPDMIQTPSLTDLQHEEERVRIEEETELERKREAAARLARERGLNVQTSAETEESIMENKIDHTVVDDLTQPVGPVDRTENIEVRTERTGESSTNDFVPARLPYFS